MSDVNANIGVNIDTSAALAELKNLQRQIASFHSQISKSSATAAMAQKNLQTNLLNAINATGKFHAQMGVVRTSTESFTDSLEKNKLSMREYFRYAGGASKTFGKAFRQEFDTIGKVAEERVKKMQTQYIKMGRDASGAMKAMSITPNTLNMKDYGTQVALSAQKQALFNQLVRQGSTSLLNFGKNTQWAGRQLMVGFTVPLMYLGTVAAKTFMDLEEQALKFKRVYGEMFTTSDQTNKALKDVELLAKEFTKYGVAVSKTMEMAASAAAMGKTGAELTAQVAQATRLAVLGNVEQEQALETTISVTNAFGIAAEDLAKKIDFLNAVENQTVVSIEDLTIAIPKAGPVVKQLGGDVEDLAFFLTAMKEGGINASEGANALKSGLASLINPSEKASKMLMGLGVNIKGIVEGNAGDVKNTVIEFSQALDTLDPLNRARAIEQLFGKFQFSRLSTLFQNVTKDGTQASRVLELAKMEIEELAILSERELKTIEDAVGTNFKSAVESLKLTIAPIGKTFLEAVTPIVKSIAGLLENFNNLGDGTKKFIVVATTLVGIIGPTLLMTFGLLANGAANIVKLFLALRVGFLKLGGNTKILGESTQYLNSEQLEAATVAASLNQAHTKLTQSFNLETVAVQALRKAYIDATLAATNFARANPGMMAPGRGGAPKKFAKGATYVPGRGNKDTVPAVLTPGEAVIPAPVAQDPQFQPIIDAMVNGKLQGFNSGVTKVTQSGKKDKSTPMSSKDAFAHVGKAVSVSAEDYIKQSAGLSEYDKARIRAVDGLEKAAGRSGLVTDYRGLGFAFDSELNNQLAKKNGVAFDVFEKEWMSKGPDKWDATKDRKLVKGLYGPDNSIIDNAMLKKIKEEADKNNGRVTDDLVKKSFQDLPASAKSTKTYQAMDTAFQARSQYGVGRGMSHNPRTMEKKFKAAITAGTIAKAPVVIIDGDATTYNGKTTPLGKDGKPQKLSTLLGSPGFELPEKSHVIVERTDSRGRKKSGSIFAYDPRFPQPIFISKGASTTRANVGRNPNLISKEQIKEVKKRLSSRSLEEMKRIDADVRSSSMAKVKPTDFGKQIAPTAGYSFPVAGIGGVYEKDGKKVFVKPMIDERSAKAELRANRIAREAHGLDTPEQTMKVMADPNNKNRKIIVLESAFDPKFSEAKMTGKFTKDQYFKQLTASLLRGDKDLKRGNLSGNILTDPGAAGVFDRASGRREYSSGMKSMLSQAEINLLGVKGGASKDFAKATVNIPKGMTADQYHKSMIAEIDRVLPKLKEVVSSFGLTDPVEKAAYKDMIARLEKGKMTDWRGIHKMHSSVLVTKDEMLEDDKSKKLSKIKKQKATRAVTPIVPSKKDRYIADIPEGKSVVQKPLRLRGRSDAPLSQSDQIRQRAAQEGVSASTARRKLVAEGKLIEATKKQSEAVSKSTTSIVENEKATRLSKESMRSFGNKANLAVGAVSGLTIAASFTSGKIGEMAQKIMPFVFGLQGILLLLPMLMNPLVGLPLAIGAIVAGIWLFKKKQDDAIKAEARLVDELYATTKKMQQVGEISGKVGASQLMARKRESATGDFSFERKGIQFGSAFLQSEIGKADIAAFETRFKAMPDIAMEEFSLKLASYVADGVIDAAQAASIADQIGIEFKNQVLGIKINGQLQNLLTSDGKDLTKEPFDIRINIAKETVDQFNNLVPNMQNQLESVQKEVEVLGDKLVLSYSSADDATIKAAETLLRDAEQRLKTIQNSINQNAAFAAGMASQSYESIQAQIDGIDVATSKTLDKLKADKAATKDLEKQALIQKEIERIEAKRESSLSNLRDMNKQVTKGIEKQIETMDQAQKNQFFTGSSEAIASRFKGTKQEQDANMLLAKTGQMEQTVLRANIEATVSSGQLGPAQATSFLNLFGDDTEGLEKTLDAFLNVQGVDDLNKLQSILGGFEDQKLAKDIMVNMSGLTDKEFQSQYSTLMLLQQLDGEEINIEVVLSDPEALLKLSKMNTAIENIPDVTLKSVELVLKEQGFPGGPDGGIEFVSKNWEYFADLPSDLRKTALQTFTTLHQTVFADDASKREWARQQAVAAAAGPGSAEQKNLAYQATYTTLIDIKTGGFTGEGEQALLQNSLDKTKDIIGYQEQLNKLLNKNKNIEGETKPRDTSLDNLLDKLRRTRDAAINTQGGMKELLRVLGSGKDITTFDGLEQQLSALKAPQEFIDFISSLDPSAKAVGEGALSTYVDLKKLKDGVVELTDKGEAAQKAFQEGILGDFQSELKLATDGIIKQKAEFIRLNLTTKDAKLTAEMLSDAQTAIALSSAKTTPEIEQITAAFKAQKAAQEDLAMTTNPIETLQNKFSEAEDEINKFFSLSNEVIKSKFAKRILAGERAVDAAEKTVKSAQEEVRRIQDIIEDIQSDIDLKQREIEENITRPIEAFQETISSIEDTINTQFDKPIAILQEESSDLANDLTLLDRAASAINKKYDAQEQALTKISDINQKLIAQDKQRISLADAITQGDISAAAQAAQDMRQAAAADASGSNLDMLKAARELEIGGLRSASGRTRLSIEERQFEISQLIYNLEEGREVSEAAIASIKETKIVPLERERERLLKLIRIEEDKIYNITNGVGVPKERNLRIAEQELAAAIALSQKKKDDLIAIEEERKLELDYLDDLQTEWEEIKAGIAAAELSTISFHGKITEAIRLAGLLKTAFSNVTIPGTDIKATDKAAADKLAADKLAADKAAADKAAADKAAADKAAADKAAADRVAAIPVAGVANKIAATFTEAVVNPVVNAIAAAIPVAGVVNKSTVATTTSATKPKPVVSTGRGGGLKGAQMLAAGGMVNPKYFAAGGYSRGTDTVPAMLSPGEFVMSKYAVSNYGIDKMKAINNGSHDGERVYNYNLSVNVKSDANPNDIARVVMTQIRQIDSQKVRGQRA